MGLSTSIPGSSPPTLPPISSNCNSDETDITPNKLGAKFGISVISIIYFVFILFIISVILSAKVNIKQGTVDSGTIKSKMSEILTVVNSIASGNIIHAKSDTFIARFTDWFTKVGHSINSGSVLAILAAGVVMGFNSLIMTPIISTMFPVDITTNMQIPGRDAYVNPGQFFIALIGFILSLILFFFVAEIIYLIRLKFKFSLIVFVIVILFLFLTFMLIWNAIETDKILKQPNCIPSNIKSFQLKQNSSIEQDIYHDQGQKSKQPSNQSSKPPIYTPSQFGSFI